MGRKGNYPNYAKSEPFGPLSIDSEKIEAIIQPIPG